MNTIRTMRSEHDYSVLGHSRAVVGRYLGAVAAGVAAASVLLVGLGIEAAKQLGFGDLLPPIVVWPVTAGAVWAGLHWLFATHAWKWPGVSHVVKIPNLAGEWRVTGATLDDAGNVTYPWTGVVHISQTWEKIKITLRTATSSSFSISAALHDEPGAGHRLTYSYMNEPKLGQTELRQHVGFADLLFDRELQSADGEYFNNKGRMTKGTMRLDRPGHIDAE